MTSDNTPTPNREELQASILEQLIELSDTEAVELEDFIVNHCDNMSFMDEDGNYPNIFRIFVTGSHA